MSKYFSINIDYPIEPFAVSASVASRDAFALVSLEWTGASIKLDNSGCLMLPCLDGKLTKLKVRRLREHLRSREISHTAVLRGEQTAKSPGSRLSRKLRSVLKRTPHLLTFSVHRASVARWTVRKPLPLPAPHGHLSNRHRQLQTEGIELAASVAERILRRRALEKFEVWRAEQEVFGLARPAIQGVSWR